MSYLVENLKMNSFRVMKSQYDPCLNALENEKLDENIDEFVTPFRIDINERTHIDKEITTFNKRLSYMKN
jgi:hypothetical protein